jgi:hypothetical protein
MEDKKPEENKMEIEISKYKNLVDALGDPVRVARMVILIATVAAILAVGIIAVVCGIKRFYPYKSINSNPYGATIIQDEDNEIIYWLFNTADLWANSGIPVKEGDIISVRTSGAFHTAIHHLVKNANNNTSMENLWVPSKGGGLTEVSPLYNRDKARLKFCIAPDLEYNTILMQVIPENICETNWLSNPNKVCYVDGLPYNTKDVTDHYKSGLQAKQLKPDIYDIGSGKENIRIRTDGILHFAVNDIALTRRIISQMEMDTIGLKLKPVEGVWFAKTTDRFDSLFSPAGLNLIKPIYYEKKSSKSDSLKGNVSICCLLERFIGNIKNDTIKRDIISCEDFKQLGLIDEYNQPVEKYWNKDKLKGELFKCLSNSTYAKQRYSDETIWKNTEDLKKLGLINTETISLKNSAKIEKLGYNADSLLYDNYQCKKGFSNLVREDYSIRDSISLKDDCLIRYTINKNKNDRFYVALYLKEQGFLKQTWQPYELEYYRYNNFVDAWFADNIGSFMIVIERKKVK